MAETRSIESAIVIPALQAGISAGLAALAIGAGGRLLEWQNWKDPAFMAAGLTGAGVWYWQLREWTNVLRLEAGWLTGNNENYYQDNPPPQPMEAQPTTPLKVHLVSDDEKHVEILDLPTTVPQLSRLAAGVLEGVSLSEATWAGGPNAVFGQAEFKQLRAELIRRGLLAWSSPGAPARGVVLTRGGRSAFRYFASLAQPGPQEVG